MCGGSKTTSQQNTSSSFTPPPQVLANYSAVTQQAQNVAATPYSAYGGELVAPVNAQQNTGIGAVNAASGIQNPANAAATGLTSASAGAINPTAVDSAAIQQYESPYQSQVINATEAEIQNQNAQQAAQLQGNSIASGAFGGDRAGIAQAQLAGQQDIASDATLANLNNQGYSQALGEANTQQGVTLGAQQNTAARQLAAGSQLGQLGQTAQTEALNEANAQTNAGTLQQTTQQAQDTAAYNQFLQQQAYPFQTTGWLANIVEGIGSQSGGSSAGQTTQQGSGASQIAGAALGLASFLARGGRIPQRAAGGGIVPHRDAGGSIYLPQSQIFNPTLPSAGLGLGSGSIVPTTQPLAVGHTMPTATAAPAMPAPQTPAQQAQSMTSMAKAVQGAGNGLGNAFTNSPLGDAYNDAQQDAQEGWNVPASSPAATDANIDPSNMGLGAGGLSGIYARGGTVLGDGGLMTRPHYMGGGTIASDPGSFGSAGSGIAAVSRGTPPAPVPVSNPRPANAPSYSVFPVQMSDGSWSTTQSQGITSPTIALARGGIAGRPHFDDGGVPVQPPIDPFDNLFAPVLAARPAATPDVSSNYSPAWPPGAQGVHDASMDGQPVTTRGTSPLPVAPTGAPVSMDFTQLPSPPTGLAGASAMPIPALPPAQPKPALATVPYARGLVVPAPPAGAADNGYAEPASPGANTKGLAPAFADRIQDLQQDAELAGIPTTLISGYRDNAQQAKLYANYQAKQAGQPLPYPEEGSGGIAAPPGASNHNAGLAADVIASNPAQQADLVAMARQPWRGIHPGADFGDAAHFEAAEVAQGARTSGIAGATGIGSANAYAPTPSLPAAIARGAPAGIGAGEPQVSAPQFPDSATTPATGKTGLFGLNLSPDTRQLMLAAGLGIMGGTSRSPLVNIGQGGLAGIQAANQMRNTASEIGLRSAQTQKAQNEAQIQKMQLDRMMKKAHGDVPSEGVGPSPAPLDQTITKGSLPAPSGEASVGSAAPNSIPAPAHAQGASAARPVDDWDLGKLTARQNAALDDANFNIPGAAENANALGQRITHIQNGGLIPWTDGSYQQYPGLAAAKAQTAGQIAGSEASAKSHYELKEVTAPDGTKKWVPQSSILDGGAGTVAALPSYVTEGQNQLMKEEPEITSALQNRQQVRQRMNAIAEIVQNYQTGRWAEPSADIVAHLRAAGLPIQDTDTINPAAYEKFIKNQMQNVFGDVKAMGGQPRIAEIQGFQKAAAGPSLQPSSNIAILGQGLGILDSLDKHDNDYIAAKYGKNGNPSMSSRLAFDQQWINNPENSLGKFIDAETKNLSYKGQPLPKTPQEAVAGQVYQIATGERLRWTGTGWKPAKWGTGPEARTYGAASPEAGQ